MNVVEDVDSGLGYSALLSVWPGLLASARRQECPPPVAAGTWCPDVGGSESRRFSACVSYLRSQQCCPGRGRSKATGRGSVLRAGAPQWRRM